jgi:hypothetical protein
MRDVNPPKPSNRTSLNKVSTSKPGVAGNRNEALGGTSICGRIVDVAAIMANVVATRAPRKCGTVAEQEKSLRPVSTRSVRVNVRQNFGIASCFKEALHSVHPNWAHSR